MIVYAIDDRDSFEEAQLIYEVQIILVKPDTIIIVFISQYQCKFLNRPSVPTVLCANKSDLAYQRTVTHAEAVAWATPLKIPVIATSAKTGQNVHEVFVTLVKTTGRPKRVAKGGLLEYSFAILGSGAVGKTSICIRFNSGNFVESYVSH